MTKARLLEKLDAEVERWNRDHAVGARVLLPGVGLPGETVSTAFVENGERAAIFVTWDGVKKLPIPVDLCTPC